MQRQQARMRARIHNAAVRSPHLKHTIARNAVCFQLGFLQPLSCQGFHRIHRQIPRHACPIGCI